MTGLLLGAAGCARAQNPAARGDHVPVVGLPCEGCEEVFRGLPEDLGSASRIAPADEPGEALRIEGTVFSPDGRPAAGVIVYAYHTNAEGIYPRDGRGPGISRHGRLRGWARTDQDGRYRFDTIRPGAYPDRDQPAHVHMHVIEPGRCSYYVDDILFEGDPRLSPEKRSRMTPGRGGSGLVTPRGDAREGWIVIRDIHLGERIPGYAGCSQRGSPS